MSLESIHNCEIPKHRSKHTAMNETCDVLPSLEHPIAKATMVQKPPTPLTAYDSELDLIDVLSIEIHYQGGLE